MRSAFKSRKPSAAQEDVILFVVGKKTFAIPAGAVDEIRNLEGLTAFRPSFHPGLKKVTHTLVRSKKDPEKTYFVVNGAHHFGINEPAGGRVMVLRGGSGAILVDAIDRMTQIAVVHALPHAFNSKERDWYRGLAVIDGRVIPVVREESFLSKSDLAVLVAQHSTAAQGASA